MRFVVTVTLIDLITVLTHHLIQLSFADGGVDEDMFKQYWADLALECNHWGAFCSKVSPNVNVLALIQVGLSCLARKLAGLKSA